MSMGCEQYRADIFDSARGTLDSLEQDRLDIHLRECSECRSTLQAMISIQPMLESNPASPPPPHYFSTILPNVRKKLEAKERIPFFSNALWTKLGLPLAAALVMFILLINLPLLKISDHEREDFGNLSGLQWSQDELLEIANMHVARVSAAPSIAREENFMYALNDESISLQLAGMIFNDGSSNGSQSQLNFNPRIWLDDLTDKEVDLLVLRLSERTIL